MFTVNQFYTVLPLLLTGIHGNVWIGDNGETNGDLEVDQDQSLPDTAFIASTIQTAFVTSIISTHDKICRRNGLQVDIDTLEQSVYSCTERALDTFFSSYLPMSAKNRQITKFAIYKITTGITDFVRLSPQEQEVLRSEIVIPLCTFAMLFLPCLPPQVAECTTNTDIKAVDYMQRVLTSICTQEGSRVVEFLGSGGYLCVGNYSESLTECDYEFDNDTGPQRLQEFCRSLRQFDRCGQNMVSSCIHPTPAGVMMTILKEVRDWTDDTCAEELFPEMTGGTEKNVGIQRDLGLGVIFVTVRYLAAF